MSDGSGPSYGPRRVNIGGNWDENNQEWGWNVEEDSDPIGVWGNTPIGEPYILLLMVAMYVVYIRIRRKRV